MPTYIRIAYAQQPSAFQGQFSPVSIFLIIGLIEVVVAVLTGGQYATFGEQSLW